MVLGEGNPRVLALFLFALVLSASGYLLVTHRPLARLGGLTDEWFDLGSNLAVHGTLGWGDAPIALRPPGYPAFIAAVLRGAAWASSRAVSAAHNYGHGIRILYLAQALLLSATTALIFVWLRRRVGVATAFAAALVYGLNPYSLVLPGLLHYDTLHLFLLVAGCIALDRSLRASGRLLLPLAASGALWGAVALVRPVTLPLPVFAAAMMWAYGLRGRRALAAALLFAAAMASVVAPWTVRNHRVAGSWAPVNVQGWFAVWGSTVAPMRLDPDEFQWRRVAILGLQPVFLRVTGEPYSYGALLRHNAALEAAFRDEALRNIRMRPAVYVWNVARGFVSLGTQINTSLVAVFERVQRAGEAPQQQEWFWEGMQHERRATTASRLFGAVFWMLTVLAGLGIARSLGARDVFAVVPALVFLCLALGHAATFVDMLYYYLKLPFLVVFAALGIDALRQSSAPWRRRAADVAGGLVVGGTVAATGALLLS